MTAVTTEGRTNFLSTALGLANGRLSELGWDSVPQFPSLFMDRVHPNIQAADDQTFLW